jgi:hypothetical protein
MLRSKKISKKEHPHRDLSTSLRFGRDDKGERGAPGRVVAEQELFFHHLGRAEARHFSNLYGPAEVVP